ncbi:MAG: hypothetical protein DMD72_12845 [Gemmatimonadetes bacterium]|nr:MAG: hypothetical protein DMD72_12845 [Gemmatimonadota bacterium]PYO78541.1 MAG: hypothetical protein DMD63_07065 [Gemmatimonadota bacterium]
MSITRIFAALAGTALLAGRVEAQQPPAGAQPTAAQPAPRIPRATASTRASVQVLIDSRFDAKEGGWFGALNLAGPARIAIDYGQPHLRGRNVIGMPGVVPWDSVWRTGANMSTQLSTEVDMTIGNTFVPRGVYTLFSLPTRSGWKLVISKEVLQWGTDYDPSKDFARIDLRQRTLPEPIESLTFWLIPAIENPPSTTFPHGVLKFAWGTTELSTDWKVGR